MTESSQESLEGVTITSSFDGESETALTTTSSDSSSNGSSKKKYKSKELFRRLWKDANTDHPYSLVIGFLAMLGSAAANQAAPRVLGRIMDERSTSIAIGPKSNTTLSLLLLVVGGGASSLVRTTVLRRVQNSFIAKRRSEFFSQVLKQKVEWFQFMSDDKKEEDDDESVMDTSPTALQAIITNDIPTMAQTITTNLVNTGRSLSSILFGTVNLCLLDDQVMTICLSLASLLGTTGFFLRNIQKKYTKLQHKHSIAAESFCHERMEHIATVQTSSRQVEEGERYQSLLAKWDDVGKRASWVQGVFMGFTFVGSILALGAVYATGGARVRQGRLTHGQLESIKVYSIMVGFGTNGFMRGWSSLMQGLVCAERFYDVMDFKEEGREEEKVEVALEASSVQKLKIENVTFSYASNPKVTVLKDISLSIARGEVVALVGKNGSGKSTIASLLVALYQAQSGRVVCETDGAEVDFATLDRKNQSQIVQLVPQQPALFEMSIWDNVTYTNPTASTQDAEKALAAANCNDFISKLKEGVEFNVGRNGGKLSGGQRQRLALARALLSDPALLILDEPNSSMDAEGNTAISEAVEACRDGEKRGLLLITHRVSSLTLADKIVVLKDGIIVESGSFNTLSENKDSELCQLMPDLQVQ